MARVGAVVHVTDALANLVVPNGYLFFKIFDQLHPNLGGLVTSQRIGYDIHLDLHLDLSRLQSECHGASV
jgi:hypothetical protein